MALVFLGEFLANLTFLQSAALQRRRPAGRPRHLLRLPGDSAARDIGPAPDRRIDPWRPAVIARSLDQFARAVDRISEIVWEINRRNQSRGRLRSRISTARGGKICAGW
jgi:hypothetical protein